jgi:hypothetical protein
VSVPSCFLKIRPPTDIPTRPGRTVLKVDAIDVLSTESCCGSKPSSPDGIRNDVRLVPAFSSVVVGAARVAMVGT